MESRDDLSTDLAAIVGGGGTLKDEPMARQTTFEIGGPADLFIRPATIEQLRDVVALLAERAIPWRVIGRGSDLLVSDAGLRCAVVEVGERLSAISIDGNILTVQAGASNKDVAEAACAAGLAGYEFASGIPGSVGGAAIMNAGAYDGEFKDVAMSTTCITPAGALTVLTPEQADWSYRHSAIDEAGYVVAEVRLHLTPADPAQIRARMDDLERRRAEKQPLEMPSAGSTFKRPEGYYVGKLVQDCGLRGYRVGGAQVSEKHTGFVVNAGGATAEDVRQLIADVQAKVRAQFGVDLVPEVRMWGFDE